MLSEKSQNKFKKIAERPFEFAILIIELYKFLTNKNEYVISKHILRSGTSIGVNVHESQAVKSQKDFIPRMSITSKEAQAADCWLRLLDKSGFLSGFSEKQILFSEI